MLLEYFILLLSFFGFQMAEVLTEVYIVHEKRTSLPRHGLVVETHRENIFTSEENARNYAQEISQNWENRDCNENHVTGTDTEDPDDPETCKLWFSVKPVDPEPRSYRKIAT